jgi:UDP-N-acetylglucosamine pyrophosphorylase
MTEFIEGFFSFVERMRAESLPQIFIDTFAYYYEQLASGQTGLIAETDICPVTNLTDAESLPDESVAVGEGVLGKTAVIKLNGGLGTGMGLEQAKSLLEIKNGLTFLDIIAKQSMINGVPLILMNSFATHSDSLAHL